MSVSAEGYRIAIARANENLVAALAERDEAQLDLNEAFAIKEAKQIAVEQAIDSIDGLQARIDELEAEQEPIPGPDQPTNIPDHAEPWTPIEPAEGDNNE